MGRDYFCKPHHELSVCRVIKTIKGILSARVYYENCEKAPLKRPFFTPQRVDVLLSDISVEV
jgi:hypothetical protein